MMRMLCGVLLSLAVVATAPPAGAAASKESKKPETREAKAPGHGQEKARTSPGEESEKGDGKSAPEDKPEPKLSTLTTGEIDLGGRSIPYEVETGAIQLFNEKDEPIAEVFFVTYRKTPVDARRPLMFCFNGGPGSSAVWLHLGGLGPYRVDMPGDGTTAPAPPYQLEPNPASVLDVADLVFVDPVGTGFSRPEDGKQAKNFTGLEQDVNYLADFIRRYISDHDRWESPKFLLGESYGAMRVSGLAAKLQDRYGLYLNGVVLLSGLLDFRTLLSKGGNDLPHLCFLPAMATTAAWHRGVRDEEELEETLSKARKLAGGDYALALLAGDRLDPEARKSLAHQLGTLTDTPAQLWLDSRLRLQPAVFRKQLLAGEKQIIGRFDGRVKAPARNVLTPGALSDPSFDVVWGAFSTTINHFLRTELEAEAPQTYEVLGKLPSWDMGASNAFANVDDRLEAAMRQNPHLHVLVQCGYFDLATPPDSILHSIHQLDLPPAKREQITVSYYQGGHMFYLNPDAALKMRADLTGLLRRSVP